MTSIPKATGLMMLTIVVTALVGCGRNGRTPEANAPQPEASTATTPTGEAASTSPLAPTDEVISVTGVLTAYDPSFPWHDHGPAGHDDGVAPLATFQLQHPTEIRGREVRLLFKYGQATAPPINAQTPLKTSFVFSLPRGYFDGSVPVPLIDNSLVHGLAPTSGPPQQK